MYLITIRSRLNPKSEAAEKFNDIGGAYVNCYIQFKDYEAAEKLAKLLIKEQGWIPEKMTDAWIRWIQFRSATPTLAPAGRDVYSLEIAKGPALCRSATNP